MEHLQSMFCASSSSLIKRTSLFFQLSLPNERESPGLLTRCALNCVSPKYVCWNANHQFLRMCLHLEIRDGGRRHTWLPSGCAIVSVMCQPDWITMPRYFIKYSECFCEDVDIYFQISKLKVNQVVFYDVVGLILSVEGTNKTKNWPPLKQEGILPVESLQTWIATLDLPWVSNLPTL